MAQIKIRTSISGEIVNLKILFENNKKTNSNPLTKAPIHTQIESIQIKLNNNLLQTIAVHSLLAQPPYFSVKFIGYKKDKYEIIAIENNGNIINKKGIIK